jgi:hypothetical protein
MTEFEFASSRSSLLAVLHRFQCSIFFHSVLKNRIPAITSGNRATAAFDVKDCPEIKRRPRRDARRAKENPGVWDWKLRNKDHAAPITDKITI